MPPEYDENWMMQIVRNAPFFKKGDLIKKFAQAIADGKIEDVVKQEYQKCQKQ